MASAQEQLAAATAVDGSSEAETFSSFSVREVLKLAKPMDMSKTPTDYNDLSQAQKKVRDAIDFSNPEVRCTLSSGIESICRCVHTYAQGWVLFGSN